MLGIIIIIIVGRLKRSVIQRCGAHMHLFTKTIRAKNPSEEGTMAYIICLNDFFFFFVVAEV